MRKNVVFALVSAVCALTLCGCIVVQAPSGTGEDPVAGGKPGTYAPSTPSTPDAPDAPDAPNSPDTPTVPTVPSKPGAQRPSAPEPSAPLVATEDALDVWSGFQGYWSAADGNFFVLDRADAHSVVFRFGKWETEYDSDYCLVNGPVLTGPKKMEATVIWNGDEIPLVIDWEYLEQDGKIHIVLGGNDYQCAFAGDTQDAAYNTYLENMR